MELGRREALGLTSVMSRAPAVVHGLFLRAVSHAFSFDIRGAALDEVRVKPSPDTTKAPRERASPIGAPGVYEVVEARDGVALRDTCYMGTKDVA